MKKLLTSFYLLFSFFNSIAQLCFEPKVNYNGGFSPSALCEADFNEDGKTDIAIANRDSKITLLLGNGFGGFTNAGEFAVGFLPMSLCKADFNNDGNMDIATINGGPWNITVLLGNGMGEFDSSITPGFQISNPTFIYSADVNKDSNIDIIAATSFNIQVLLGNGSGDFNNKTSYAGGAYYSSITSADFNQDGKIDLALANKTSKSITLLQGDGVGGFFTTNNLPIGDQPSSIIQGDFNGDNKIDLATANEDSNNVSVFIGNGNGNFGLATYFIVGTSPVFLTSADFNGDSIIDLATANQLSINTSVLMGDGTGNFGIATNFSTDTFANGMVSSDFNADGKPDLALTGSKNFVDSSTVTILLSCNTIGTEEYLDDELNLYPNPSDGVFQVNTEEPIAITITNMLGHSIYSNKNLFNSNIDISNQPNGCYFILINKKGKISQEKIVINK